VRDFRVLFLSDGTATSGSAGISPEAIQSATLATLHGSFGQVLSVDETIGKIRSAGAAAATWCSDVIGGAMEEAST
jgi:ureidoacrylate peracid hydrolase